MVLLVFNRRLAGARARHPARRLPKPAAIERATVQAGDPRAHMIARNAIIADDWDPFTKGRTAPEILISRPKQPSNFTQQIAKTATNYAKHFRESGPEKPNRQRHCVVPMIASA